MTKADHPADNSAATGPPAGMTRRAMATVVDMIVFCGLSVALLLPVSSSVEWASLPADFDQVATTLSNQSWISHATGVLGIWIAMWWCYFVVGWGLVGATPGKLALGLRVVDHHDRYPIGLSRALLRLVTYIVSSATLGVGHWLIVLRADKCALHDILAGTKVVHWKRPTAVSPQLPLPPRCRGHNRRGTMTAAGDRQRSGAKAADS